MCGVWHGVSVQMHVCDDVYLWHMCFGMCVVYVYMCVCAMSVLWMFICIFGDTLFMCMYE